MKIDIQLNGEPVSIHVPADMTLIAALREELGLFSVKHGCETGECGACTVLMDGHPVNACVMLAAQAHGHELFTLEALGEHPELGWKPSDGLHPLQRAFVETGAIQCGFCTAGMEMSALNLLNKNSSPTEEEIRVAISGNLCRCTGYYKIVEAIDSAAGKMKEKQ